MKIIHQIDYFGICYSNRKTKVPTGYMRSLGLRLKGNI